MAKFITGQELEKAVYDIIWDAESVLMIVSPYIKLDDYFKKLFEKHLNNPGLHLIIAFGKNETNFNRSFSQRDFDFFKNFMNISIIYVPNLHAKYYGNERKGLITSINLYDYSFKNNIEFGVYSEVNFLSNLAPSTDQDAWKACRKIVDENEAIFIKRPVYEKKLFLSVLGKNYVKSDVLLDSTKDISRSYRASDHIIKRITDFDDELELGVTNKARPTREEFEKPLQGYCIRTGAKIPYDPKYPMSESAYKVWAQFGNIDYPEKYCHKTGQRSNGKTSMRKPILD